MLKLYKASKFNVSLAANKIWQAFFTVDADTC